MLKTLLRPPAATSLSFDPPEPAPGRAGIAVVLIVRDEARHIGEWARFHRLAGVDRFLVYDDGCTDATIAELRAALPADGLDILPWDQQLRDARRGTRLHNQVLAYAHAVRNFGARFRWMAFLDADEFLVPVAGDTLAAVLEPLENLPGISLPWHNFGTSGHREPPAGGVLRNFTRRAADPARQAPNFKMLVDPCRVTTLGVHRAGIDGGPRTWNDRGDESTLRKRTDAAFFTAERLQLNHYYTRSWAELMAKTERGSNLKTGDRRHAGRILRRVAAIERDEVTDRTALAWLEHRGIDLAAWPPPGE